MAGTINALFAATVAFVAAHFLLSSRPLRGPLVAMLGEGGFRIAYSIVGLATFGWMVSAFGDAPRVEIWVPGPPLRWVPVLVMPIACILVVAGLTTPSLTAMGGERSAIVGGPQHPAPGIVGITRHPALWGIVLWALSHLAVNGDLASIIVMGGILILCGGGMAHIDLRREAVLGAAWGPTRMTTSALPFAAILSGRARLDWRGIGWKRPAAGLALYGVLFLAHPWIAGVSALPL